MRELIKYCKQFNRCIYRSTILNECTNGGKLASSTVREESQLINLPVCRQELFCIVISYNPQSYKITQRQ